MAPPPSPPPRLSFLIGSYACASILSVALGFFAGALRGEQESSHSVSDSATMGAFAATIGACLSLLVLAPPGVRIARRVRMAAAMAALVQVLAALLGGGMLYAMALPQGTPFAASLVSALALSLIVLAFWVRAAVRCSQASNAAEPTAGATDGPRAPKESAP